MLPLLSDAEVMTVPPTSVEFGAVANQWEICASAARPSQPRLVDLGADLLLRAGDWYTKDIDTKDREAKRQNDKNKRKAAASQPARKNMYSIDTRYQEHMETHFPNICRM